MKIPKFIPYGKNDPSLEDEIQPVLDLRDWVDLSLEERECALQHLRNNGWVKDYSREILITIKCLNTQFLRRLPGERLHHVKPRNGFQDRGGESEKMEASLIDFEKIFTRDTSSALFYRMISEFAECYIDGFAYRSAQEEMDITKKAEHIAKSFEKFDKLANCLNHIFEQFCVNVVMTRNGLIPRQDERIVEGIYKPVLSVLADPCWKSVNDDLDSMFKNFLEGNYAETITDAHRSVQRFLQIIAGEEGKSGKGEVGKLFQKVIDEGLIPIDRYSKPLIKVFQGYLSSQRATKSTAKPTQETATQSDALLVMNTVMVFLQHCLQN